MIGSVISDFQLVENATRGWTLSGRDVPSIIQGGVEVRRFDTARDFLDALRPSSAKWLGAGQFTSPFVFRGHADAEWRLIPSALRGVDERSTPEEKANNRLWILVEKLCREGLPYAIDQAVARHAHDKAVDPPPGVDRFAYVDRFRIVYAFVQAENAAVKRFLRLANRLGHAVPPWTEPLPSFIGEPTPLHQRLFTGEQPHGLSKLQLWKGTPAFALAQHYGVPTRLLDWTRHPFVAAFMAASDVVRLRTTRDHAFQSDDLAVWATAGDTQGPPGYLAFEDAEHATNPNLHAQDGVVSYAQLANHHYLVFGSWPSLDEMAGASFVKLLLPHTEVDELLRLLFAEGYSRAHLFPGFASVAETAMSMSWDIRF